MSGAKAGGPPAGAGIPIIPAGGAGFAGGRGFGGGGPGGGGGLGGGEDLSAEVLNYVKQHGGGTIAVASQSSAASAIIGKDANVAGIGGFSGREST